MQFRRSEREWWASEAAQGNVLAPASGARQHEPPVREQAGDAPGDLTTMGGRQGLKGMDFHGEIESVDERWRQVKEIRVAEQIPMLRMQSPGDGVGRQ